MPNISQNVAPTPARVLLSYSHDAPGIEAYVRENLHELARRMQHSLETQGLTVVVVDPISETAGAAGLVADAAGVILLGGADVDPQLYGAPVETDTLYGVDPHADRFELDLAGAARVAGVPLLGVCRGFQLINVSFGGTLHQDIGQGLHNIQQQNSTMVDHDVALVAGSRLAEIYEVEHLSIRSGHHQAIDRVGDGLEVAAVAADGIVEAVEAQGPGGWVTGVQWHPEDPAGTPEHLSALTQEFARVVNSELARV